MLVEGTPPLVDDRHGTGDRRWPFYAGKRG
ncbi:hypothetical protein L288_10900 [Sphingobium quisquiliarum P25]|uniref:Uncharacterized protein n=1 Tax=Sphingobium quisquiliarum P25 TaxID=1329909 RepID=T0IA77_9SPHN|nr:hypothetical protein L288_10900 [Sphingobium quisquiliarum P25]